MTQAQLSGEEMLMARHKKRLKVRGWMDAGDGQWKHHRLEWAWPLSLALTLEDERDGGDPGVLALLGEAPGNP